jgi:hypothetical protein
MTMAHDVEKLCKVFVKMRDARAELKRAFDKRDEEIKTQQEAINACLLDVCKDLKVDSLKTSSGTAFRTVKTKYWVSDWEAVEQFIIDNDGFELMEKRIAQNAMKQWAEDYPENLPPSLNVDSRYAITIRRN